MLWQISIEYFLIGSLTRDPDVRYTSKGTAVADLSVAINRFLKSDDGDQKEEVTYVDVTLWARLAEISGQFLKKGKPVFIEGRLHLDTSEDKQTLLLVCLELKPNSYDYRTQLPSIA